MCRAPGADDRRLERGRVGDRSDECACPPVPRPARQREHHVRRRSRRGRADGGGASRAIVSHVDRSGGTMSVLSSLLTDLPQPDAAARDAVAARAGTVLRPTGALARLDEVAAWLAAWQ